MNLPSTSLLPGAVTGSAATATDARALAALRNGAARDPKAAIKETAKQFETLFMQQLLKGMREAQSAMSSGMLTNQGTQLGNDMLDAEYAKKISGAPGGLADVIARQLERQMGLTPGPIPSTKSANTSLPIVPSRVDATPKIPEKSAAGFVRQHTQAAQAAEAATGIPAAFMIAQSAHETGWGRKEIIGRDGTRSHNLFGIKAGASWTGPTVDVLTTEVIGGKAHKVVQKFRAYASHAESFADYAKLMKDSPRYQAVVAAGSDAKGFAQGLQRAGYATDPAYAAKLARVIDTTLRLQRGEA